MVVVRVQQELDCRNKWEQMDVSDAVTASFSALANHVYFPSTTMASAYP